MKRNRDPRAGEKAAIELDLSLAEVLRQMQALLLENVQLKQKLAAIPTGTMQFTGKLDIGNSQMCGQTLTDEDQHRIVIRVTDADSRAKVLEVEVSLSDFAMAVTGHGHRECNVQFNANGIDLFGKEMETKTETIFVPYDMIKYDNRERAPELVKPLVQQYEVDGWVAHLADITNTRNGTAVHKDFELTGYNMKVHFRRYVPKQ